MSGKGILFLMIGNSGTGKDSVMRYVAGKVPNLKVVKRYITRAPSEDTEDYYSINKNDFNKENYFLIWEAYEKFYGVSREVLDGLMNGKNYILNISRKALKKTMEHWCNSYVIECVIPINMIVRRLENRGRESEEEINKRVDRALNAPILNPDCTLDTSDSDVSVAGEKLLQFIKNALNH